MDFLTCPDCGKTYPTGYGVCPFCGAPKPVAEQEERSSGERPAESDGQV